MAGFEDIADKKYSRPLVLVEGMEKWAKTGVISPAGKYLPYIKSIGTVTRRKGMLGSIHRSDITTTLVNTDRHFSELFSAYNSIIGQNISYKAGFVEIPLSEFLTFFTGTISRFEFREHLFEITVKDKIDLTAEFKIQEITEELFPSAKADVIGKPLPILYGRLISQQDEHGVCRAYMVDTENLKYLVAGRSVKDILSVYALNEDGTLYKKLSKNIEWTWENTTIYGEENVLNADFAHWQGQTPLWWEIQGSAENVYRTDGHWSTYACRLTGNDGHIVQCLTLRPGLDYRCVIKYRSGRKFRVGWFSARLNKYLWTDDFDVSTEWKASAMYFSISPSDGELIEIHVYVLDESSEYDKTVDIDSIGIKPWITAALITLIQDYSDYIISCDVEGVYDAETGQLLENPADIIRDFLNNYGGVDWLDIDHASFDEAKNNADELGLRIAGAIYEKRSVESLLKEMLISSFADVYLSRDGKIALKIFKPSVDFNIAKRFTDVADIIQGSFRAYPELDLIMNAITVKSRYSYVWETFLSVESVEDNDSIVNLGKRYNKVFEFSFLRDPLLAKTLAVRYLMRYSYPPQLFAFAVKLQGLNVDLGDIVEVKHMFAPAGCGKDMDRIGEVVELEFDADRMRVNVLVQDTESWLANLFFLADEEEVPANWDDATEEQRAKWGYLCDETKGTFPDGSPGKRLW